jgi:uncharacterized membrane protein YphA (DoxX/SURF4 family)
MNLALWIVAIVLAAVFAASGLMKEFLSKEKLVTSGQGWAQDFSPTSIRLIGVAEILLAGLHHPGRAPAQRSTTYDPGMSDVGESSGE